MFASIYPLISEDKEVFNKIGYVMIEEQPVPEMHPEFDPGPKDEEEARFWNTAVSVYHVYFEGRKPCIESVDYKWMKDCYKFIYGRSERIHYWQVMRHLKKFYKGDPDGLPDGSCVEAMI